MRKERLDLSKIADPQMATYSLTLQVHSQQKQVGLSKAAGVTGTTSSQMLNLTDDDNLLKVLGSARAGRAL